MPRKGGENILVIPDYHAIPGVDNKRAALLGKHIVEWKPDVVVCLGDWFDMESICKWSKKFELENKRYRDDINAGLDAMDRMFQPVRKHKKKLPRLVFLRGNHENRVFDLAGDLPIYQGIIGPEDFDLKYYGWEEYDYKTSVEVGGFLFSHAFASGAMGKPIGGKNVANTMIRELKCSAVQGHNHIYDAKMQNNRMGKPTWGITAGCFFHPTHRPNWCRDTIHLWHRGVVHLSNAQDGNASVEWVWMEDL